MPSTYIPTKRHFASLRTISALVMREMATSYGRSPGGYLWAVLEPVGGIALLSLVFSFALKTPAMGINFPLFYATGMLPFVTFNGTANKLAGALLFSRPLLAYPSVTFLDAIIARFITNMVTDIMVAYTVFFGILSIFDTRVILDISTILLAMLMSAGLALGVGTLNCFLFTRFPLWHQIWVILMRPMFFLSCVFMVFDGLPRAARDWLWYNPVVHVIGIMRRGFYANYDAAYASPGYVFGFSGVCFTLGLIFLRRYQYSLLNRS